MESPLQAQEPRDATGALARATCVVVPAFQAEASLGAVLDDVARELPNMAVIVVCDGSTDGTAKLAAARGVDLVRHERNRGKGHALVTGLRAAAERGFTMALTVDADGQHPAASAREVLFASADPEALVLGVRDLSGAGAPRANRMSNAISNFFLSRFTGRTLHDTQCGLRRYPIARTLALGAHADGYAFEAEVLLLAARRGVPIVEERVRVLYPEDRVSHFHAVKDPARIIAVVLRTLARSRRLA